MNKIIDGDNGESCQSPYHNEDKCHICQEQKKYENVCQCPDCMEFYDCETGDIINAPLYSDCEKKVCIVCGLENY